MKTFTINHGVAVLSPYQCNETKAMLNDWCDFVQELERRAKRNLIIRQVLFSVIGALIGYMVTR